MRHSERELCDLLEEFDVNVCTDGARDFVELCGMLAFSMGFAGRGQCDLGGDVRWLAEDRGMPLVGLYSRMDRAVSVKLAENPALLVDRGVMLPRKFTSTGLAVALSHWMAGV